MTATRLPESRTYTVVGMTCSHRVSSVREELSELAGVDTVDVDLESGRVVVSGTGFLDDAVKAAVARADMSRRHEESFMNTFFSAWAAAIGAAGCGRCAIAA